MFTQPANEGVNAANRKHSFTCLDLSSMGTNSNKVVVADFNTDQKCQCLHRFQAGFGYVEAFRYLSMSGIFSLTYVQPDVSCMHAFCYPACKLTPSPHTRMPNIQQKYSYNSRRCTMSPAPQLTWKMQECSSSRLLYFVVDYPGCGLTKLHLTISLQKSISIRHPRCSTASLYLIAELPWIGLEGPRDTDSLLIHPFITCLERTHESKLPQSFSHLIRKPT